MRNYTNLLNKKAGWLKILELTDIKAKNGTTKLWKCKCKCGNIVYKTASKLNEAIKHNYNLSCGCSKNKENLVGKIYNDFKIIKFIKDLPKSDTLWQCECIKCGKVFDITSKKIKKNLNICKEELKRKAKIENALYTCFARIKRRCYNQNSWEYKYYGGKGVKICDEWLNNSKKFVEWSINNGYIYKKNEKGYNTFTIDRIDSNGDYSPENCRWVDMQTQLNNTTRNIFFTYKGETKTLAQWCRELNKNYKYVHYLIKNKNKTFEEAIKYKKRG